MAASNSASCCCHLLVQVGRYRCPFPLFCVPAGLPLRELNAICRLAVALQQLALAKFRQALQVAAAPLQCLGQQTRPPGLKGFDGLL